MRAFYGIGCTALALALGCGSSNDAAPRLIDGGGVGDGEIDGRVNVHVIDGATFEPIANAKIQIGEPGEVPLTGLTDSSGLLQVDDESLAGPTTITVDATADGYALATWFGANGANVTIPIQLTDDDRRQPQAILSGTIAGWEQLVPEPGHVLFAFAQASQSLDPRDPSNRVTGGDSTACINAIGTVVCDLALNARAGTVGISAVIVDRSDNGTPGDPTDDVETIIGFAHALDITVEDGVDQSGIELQMIDPGELVPLDLSFEALPSGLTDSFAVIQIAHDTNGLMLVGLFDPDTGALPLSVPALSSGFAGASYAAIGLASDGEAGAAGSAIRVSGVTDAAAGIDFGPWLDVPSGVAVQSGLHRLDVSEEVALYVTEIRESIGNELAWELVVLDGRADFELPEVEGAELAAGDYLFSVTAFEVPDIDLGEFAVDDVVGGLLRTADVEVEFTLP